MMGSKRGTLSARTLAHLEQAASKGLRFGQKQNRKQSCRLSLGVLDLAIVFVILSSNPKGRVPRACPWGNENSPVGHQAKLACHQEVPWACPWVSNEVFLHDPYFGQATLHLAC